MATFVIARLTFLEAVRRRIVLAAVLLGVAFLILYATGFYFAQRDITPSRPARPVSACCTETASSAGSPSWACTR